MTAINSYWARAGWSKRPRRIEASSPAEAAYLAEGSGEPMAILPREDLATWRFRRFDESPLWAFTVKVWPA